MTGIARMLAPLAVMALLAAAAQTEPAALPDDLYGAPPGLAQVAAQLNELLYGDAGRDYEQARAICNQGYDAADDDEARAFFLRFTGESYMQMLSPRCLDIYRQVIERFPNTSQVSWVKYAIGRAYTEEKLETGTPEERARTGIAAFAEFLKDYPGHPKAAQALWWSARSYESLGDDEAALAQYQQAADLYPNHWNADVCSMSIIRLHLRHQRWDDAIAAAWRYLETYPDRDPAPVHMMVGFCYANKGDAAPTLAECDKALSYHAADDPQRAEMLYSIAATVMGLGEYEEAHAYLALIRKSPVLSLPPWGENAEYLDALACYQEGDYANALQPFKKIAATSSREADREVAQAIIGEIEAARAGQ
jgi:tetratricopeptide (TPR) repeat protein